MPENKQVAFARLNIRLRMSFVQNNFKCWFHARFLEQATSLKYTSI